MMQEIEKTISAKGGIVKISEEKYLIYDYIGTVSKSAYYLWYCEGRRGTAQTQFYPDDPGDKKSQNGSYFLKVGEDFNFKLDERPPQFSFSAMQRLVHVPSMEAIDAWIRDELPMPNDQELFNIVVNYWKLFGDYEEDYHPYILALNVFQSYLLVLLSSVFQVTISATFGAGKSTILKAGSAISYHGLLGDSVSPAARVRLTELLKPAWHQDELDSTEKEDDGLGLSMARTGNERDSFFVRWNNEKNEPDVIEHFSTFTYAIHEDIANAALLSRALAEIQLSRTKDFKLAVVNKARLTYAPEFAEKLFFWRFGAISKAIHNGFYHIQKRNDLQDLKKAEFDIQKKRKSIYEDLTTKFNDREKLLLRVLFARESQLTYSAILIERILEADIIQYLIQALNKRREEEAEPKDADFEEFAQIILNRIEAKGLRKRYDGKLAGDDNLIRDADILLKDITREMSERIVGSGEHERIEKIRDEPKTKTVAKWLKDLGFIKGKTAIHKRDGTHLILTKELCGSIYEMSEPTEIDIKEQKQLIEGEEV